MRGTVMDESENVHPAAISSSQCAVAIASSAVSAHSDRISLLGRARSSREGAVE
jgi:hypothetical protein